MEISADLVTTGGSIAFTTRQRGPSWTIGTLVSWKPRRTSRPQPENWIDRSEQDAYINDVIDHTSFLNPFIFVKSGDFPDQDTTPARKQIQDMLRDNAPTRGLPERDRTPFTETKMTGVVSTASPGIAPSSANDWRATRASTRGKLHNKDTTESDLDGHQLQQWTSLALAVGLPSGFLSQRRTAFRPSFCLRNRPP